MPETNRQECKDESCPNFYADNREGKTWAYSEGWYIGKNDASYCPYHIPDWVGRWRQRISQVDF